MKVFFASLTQPELEVDAHVAKDAEGALLLDALRRAHRKHDVILRARTKSGCNREARYIGPASKAGRFIARVREGNLE